MHLIFANFASRIKLRN